MMRSIERLLLAAAVVAAAPLHADWLVTVDGAEIETEGAWKVQGSQVVFTLPGGSLAALPVADVDLAASEARTHPPPPPTAEETAAAKPKAASRWVLTDADVARAMSPGSSAGAASAEGEAAEAAAPAVEGLSVASWEEVDSGDVDEGLALRGTVANGGRAVATDVSVQVLLFDADGQLIEQRRVTPSSTTLAPEQTSPFRADFPDVTNYSGVQFTVHGTGYATGEAAAGAGDEDGEEEEG